MKKKLMWLVYFIASLAALHSGLTVFNICLFKIPVIAAMPMLIKVVKLTFGVCGLISLITLFMPCKECK